MLDLGSSSCTTAASAHDRYYHSITPVSLQSNGVRPTEANIRCIMLESGGMRLLSAVLRSGVRPTEGASSMSEVEPGF
eukprot:1156063-Pelagomonas_calceolata.AAC.9